MILKKLEDTINSLDVTTVSEERKQVLQPLIGYVQSKVTENKNINLNFICTHNSRRSHLAQVWAQTAAHFFNIKNTHCYSGGTEATALFPIIVKTLEQAGFEINKLSESENSLYSIKYAQDEHPVIGFSKTFDNLFNPQKKFAAIMTCSQASANCPFISGTEKRIPITYEDPKEFDNTPQQVEKYQERSNQIATEMLYVFSQINTN
ncbi:Arsenate reductase thioredoxin-coupled, LMWP family [hydrothermal vent metagenome]|uniref:Arsenate reductase thioredoxin-coupled, LMWP family n=1 Tax=hydrothermal vent metagenome TaxID=652676 RepID=A0A3B0UAC7_9ZZZZ